MASRDFFIYSASFLPLNGSASATVRVPVQSDSDFELTALMGDVRALVTDEVVIAAPAITVLLVDEGTGRQLMDQAQLWPNMIGTAQRPFLLPMPKTFRGNSTVQVTLTNQNAVASQVRVSLVGYKLFA